MQMQVSSYNLSYLVIHKLLNAKPFPRTSCSLQTIATVEMPAHYVPTLLLQFGSLAEVVIRSVEPLRLFTLCRIRCKFTQKSSNCCLGSVKIVNVDFKWRWFCKNLDGMNRGLMGNALKDNGLFNPYKKRNLQRSSKVVLMTSYQFQVCGYFHLVIQKC